MKILICCAWGVSRSVALKQAFLESPDKFIFKGRVLDILPCGIEGNHEDTLKMLFDWSDMIIAVDKKTFKAIPNKYNKHLFNIGADIWGAAGSPRLQSLCHRLIHKNYKLLEDYGYRAYK